jgi:hypothetical protein
MPDATNSDKHFKAGLILIPVAIVAAILVGVWIYKGLDLSGDGARKLAENLRSIDKEMDATSRAIDPHCCGWKPHWEDSGVSTNAIDGTMAEFLSIESVDPDGADSGSLHYAELRICFRNGRLCSGRSVGVAIDVHGMVEPAGYEPDEDSSTAVRVRFDDERPVRQKWGITEDHDALYPSGHEEQFLGQLTQRHKLFVEFSYYEKAPRTVTFDLTGLSERVMMDSLKIDSKAGGPPVK